jgi:serine/threonine-protein phosphatase 2B catalytic subunit
MTILAMVNKILKDEPNMVRIEEPICVVGDIHGQYYDLLNLLQKSGEPSLDQNYLFMGDYVDRGIYGVQTCLLLFALKLNYPKNF